MSRRTKKGNIVLIEGGNKKLRKIVEDISWWFLEKEMPNHKTVDLDIILKSAKALDDSHGFCDNGEHGRNSFIIELNKELKGDDFTTLIFHELVHAKQYCTGKLKDYDKKGKKVCWNGYDYSNYQYSRQPWEMQAYRSQEVLNKQWKKSNRRRVAALKNFFNSKRREMRRIK
jgi:hypothetical protein